MVYFLNKELKEVNLVWVALCNISGIGECYAKYLCSKVGLSISITMGEIDHKVQTQLLKVVKQEALVDVLLEREVSDFIKEQVRLHSYKGRRHVQGMPVNGQNTKTNAKTAKRLVKRK